MLFSNPSGLAQLPVSWDGRQLRQEPGHVPTSSYPSSALHLLPASGASAASNIPASYPCLAVKREFHRIRPDGE